MIRSGRQVPNRFVGVVLSCLGFVISIPGIGSAQSAGSEGLRTELFVSTALGVVFHGIDDDIPVRPNIGGGVGVRPLAHLGVEFEVNQNLGRSRRWGSVGVASANVLYFFAAERPRA
jgi:hypothetical protein